MLFGWKTTFGKRVAVFAAATAMAASLSLPALAFAEVTIDETVLNEGENAVGGGTATLVDSVLDMVNVVANTVQTDQDLTMNFNGGNEIEFVDVSGSAEVTANFDGENEVEDFQATEDANLTINANGHNEFDAVTASDNANVTINVTGENEFEAIVGDDNANITIRGTECQKKDTVNVADDHIALIRVEDGDLTIDHVTVNLEGDEYGLVGSYGGNVVIDTSKIEGEDDAFTGIMAGKTMLIKESVIEITGDVYSVGLMTINHSDVEASKPDIAGGSPYRVYSYEGIELIDEENGEVREGELYDEKVWYVDTDDNDGSDVDLEADGDPAYYKCKDDDSSTKGMPKTGETTALPTLALLAIAGACTALYTARRRMNDVA